MRTIDAARAPVRIAVAGGLVLLAAMLAILLSSSSTRLAGANNVAADEVLAEWTGANGPWCQRDELVPAGTATVRLWLSPLGEAGPPVRVAVLAGGHVVAGGSHAAGWKGDVLDVALRRPIERDAERRVCFQVAAGAGGVAVGGTPTPPPVAGDPAGQVRIEYLRAGRESWWQLAPAVVERIGLGHAWRGATVAFVAAALVLASIALALRALVREAP